MPFPCHNIDSKVSPEIFAKWHTLPAGDLFFFFYQNWYSYNNKIKQHNITEYSVLFNH